VPYGSAVPIPPVERLQLAEVGRIDGAEGVRVDPPARGVLGVAVAGLFEQAMEGIEELPGRPELAQGIPQGVVADRLVDLPLDRRRPDVRAARDARLARRLLAELRDRAEQSGVVNVFVTGAITKNIAGEELAPIGSLKRAGVVAITDDGHCIQNNELMRRACEYAKMFDLTVMDHCQDYSLVTDGVMHEGYWNVALGLRGWPSAGEEMIVARNILLAELTGAKIHCQHLSAAGSVALIRDAKKRGISISGEACPHHFTLTDAAVAGSEKFWREDGQQLLKTPGSSLKAGHLPSWPSYDTSFKMNPPLRSAKDREAILEGLADGTIEILCSDHAPHCDYEKEVEFDYAPFGIIGFEAELALSLMQLVHTKRLSLSDMIAKFTVNPARLLNLKKGTLSVGADADVTVFDPDQEWLYRREDSASKSKNSPFFGWKLKGKPLATIVGGKMIFVEQGEPAMV